MKINLKVQEYENRIQNISKTTGYEFESKTSLLQNEVERLRD